MSKGMYMYIDRIVIFKRNHTYPILLVAASLRGREAKQLRTGL